MNNTQKINTIIETYQQGIIQEKIFVEKIADCIVEEETQEFIDEVYSLEKLKFDIDKMEAGLKTNYKSLDEILRIPPSALTIIAGRPAHGKTTMLFNLMMNMVCLYRNKKFFFFSYEEPRSQIALKLTAVIGREILSEYSNVRAYQNFIKNNGINKKLNESFDLLNKMLLNRNITIYDENYDIEILCKKIAWLKENHDIGVIFIDYIQKIKTKQKFNSRQLEIQYVSNELMKTAKKEGVSIVLGCQLGRGGQNNQHKIRLDNMRESGDIEQDANMVLGIFNPTMEQEREAYQNGVKSEYKRTVDLIVTILKNRDGVSNKEVVLDFDRPVNTISDKITTYTRPIKKPERVNN